MITVTSQWKMDYYTAEWHPGLKYLSYNSLKYSTIIIFKIFILLVLPKLFIFYSHKIYSVFLLGYDIFYASSKSLKF